jgi:hypothetical protein
MTTEAKAARAAAPSVTPLFRMDYGLNPPLDVGTTPLGRRVLFTTSGGTFDGPQLRGEVLPGGSDWALVRSDGATVIDVDLMLRTHDGALIYARWGGLLVAPRRVRAAVADPAKRGGLDPATYYFRTTPTFETGAGAYAWLNGIVAVGSGRFTEQGISWQISRVD